MFALLRKFSWIGGLITVARGPVGRRVLAEVKQRSARRISTQQEFDPRASNPRL